MFIDCVKLKLRAGKGGNGVVAWTREKFIPKGGPCGGNGGPGGCIYLESDPNLFALDGFRNQMLLYSENGGAGGSNNKNGKRGKDLIIKIPCGTLVRNLETQDLIHDFGPEKERVLLCQGGKGGLGNTFFRTPCNQAPNKSTPGKLGDELSIELELKLIADVGFVGFPNAGKSTLLNTLSSTQVKTANYHFTTLQPNLGFIQCENYSRIYLADIPGIIENAHQNKGLGLAFLRHIERTHVLLFVIDSSQEEREDAFQDFLILRNELAEYSAALLEKPFIVALNKTDKEGSELSIENFKKNYPFPTETLFEISCSTGQGISSLKKAIESLTSQHTALAKTSFSSSIS